MFSKKGFFTVCLVILAALLITGCLLTTPTPVAVSAITAISGTAQVGVVLTAGTLTPNGATASYQWTISATSGGTYANISGATTNKYTPVAGDATKFIKVVATGTGSYTGTATSAATAAVAAITDVTSAVFTLIAANNTVTITLTGGTFKAGAIVAADFTFAGTDAAALAVGTFTRVSNVVVTITNLTGLSGVNNTVLVKAATQATQASSVAAVASTEITSVTSAAYTLIAANNTVTITLTGGTFKTGAIAATDFTFAGTDAATLVAGVFVRTSDTVVTITVATGSVGADNTVLVKAATQATQASSVAAVASTTV